MKITLSPELERLISEKVSSGRYNSADEVVREGLELLQERENQTAQPTPNGEFDLIATIEDIFKNVPEEAWAKVPPDLSKNVDHYLYGSRKNS